MMRNKQKRVKFMNRFLALLNAAKKLARSTVNKLLKKGRDESLLIT